MVLIMVFAGLFLLFFLLGRYSGPAHLASIAGIAVNAEFGSRLVDFWVGFVGEDYRNLIVVVVYLIFVLGFPMLLYLKSHRFKHGLTEAVQTAIFALLVVTIIADPLSNLVAYDGLSENIRWFLDFNMPWVLLVATAAGYFDILAYRNHHKCAKK